VIDKLEIIFDHWFFAIEQNPDELRVSVEQKK
jgi:hypothetical protein